MSFNCLAGTFDNSTVYTLIFDYLNYYKKMSSNKRFGAMLLYSEVPNSGGGLIREQGATFQYLT